MAGANAACGVALALDADLIITSTSDVYGNAEPPFPEDGTLVLGPPTTKPLVVRGLEDVRRAPRARARGGARPAA